MVECPDMSSTAFIEPLPVIEFVTQLLNRDVQARPLADSDRVKVRFLSCHDSGNSVYLLLVYEGYVL